MTDNKTPDLAKKATGERFGTLAWMAVGSAVGAVLIAPMLRAWTGWSMAICVLVAGVGLALLGGVLGRWSKGVGSGVTTAGHGAAIFAIGTLAIQYIGPFVAQLFGGGKKGAANAPSSPYAGSVYA